MTSNTCPKCNNGRINAFSHIWGGKCFLCGGTGESPYGRGTEGAALPVISTERCKYIRTNIGHGHVVRYGAGFKFCQEHGDVYFDVIGGEVRNVIITDGLVSEGCTVKMAQQALQSVLKVKAA